MRMQLFPLEPLIDFPFRVRNAYRCLYPRICKGVEVLKAGFVKYFYQHNDTSKKRDEKKYILYDYNTNVQ